MNDVQSPGARPVGARKLAAALCLLLFVGACTVGAAGTLPKASVRTIGVVSAIGDKFFVQTVGLMAFGNDIKDFPIDSWGIDDLVVRKARSLLNKGFDVRPVTYRRAAIASAPSGWSGLSDTLRAEVSPQLDAYIVVTKAAAQYGGTNQLISGLGIVEGPFNHYFIYAIFQVAMVDGRQFSAMARGLASLPGDKPCNPMFKPFICGVNREVDRSWWPTSLNPASNQKLRGAMVEFIDKSLPNTLLQMQLTNQR